MAVGYFADGVMHFARQKYILLLFQIQSVFKRQAGYYVSRKEVITWSPAIPAKYLSFNRK